MDYYNKHYIRVNDAGQITAGWSDGPLHDNDTTDAICINDKGGYQLRLFPDGEENPPLYNRDGICLYRWDGEQVTARPEEEIAAELAARPTPPPLPTNDERLAAVEAGLLAMLEVG